MVYERANSRTNCNAMVRFNVSKEGLYKITKLVLDHNHEFVPPEQRHVLRSMRNLLNAGMSYKYLGCVWVEGLRGEGRGEFIFLF